MGGFDGMKLKDEHPLMQQYQRLMKMELSPISETLPEEEIQGQTMQRLFMTQEEKMQALKEEWGEFGLQLAAVKEKWKLDQARYQQTELSKNKNDKALAKLKTPEEIAALREERQQKAVSADKRKVFADKARHGFYKFVGAFVKMGRWMSGADKAEKETTENPTHEVPGLLSAFKKLEEMKPKKDDSDYEAKQKEFQEKHGAFYEDLKNQYVAKEGAAFEEATKKVDEAIRVLGKEMTEEERFAAIEKEKNKILEAATFTMRFGDSVQSHVEGGTKPNAFQYAKDGSKWLMKTNHSCIGAAAPNASIMTVAGYQVQKLVDADTAIEAFESKSKGVGTVSLQRMVEGVVSRTKKVNGEKVPDPDFVDLFRFSRTPEAMTPDELEKIEKLAPQFLREYMTDFLLGNYDTKGENFLICRGNDGKLIIRGIDKEAAGRKDLVPEAQHMQKDKHFFDQDTVYNQLFRRFADGSMDFDLQEADQYIKKIEQMSTEDYLKIYAPYFAQQQKDRTPEEFEQIKKNVTYRKEFIRVEARRFFGELVKERMAARPDEAAELQQKYLGGTKDGLFIFKGETAEHLKAEREKIARQKEDDAAALQEKVRQADEADEKSYKRRHAVYDFAKTIIMGVKKKPGDDYEEKRTTTVKLSDLQFEVDENMPQEVQEAVRRNKESVERLLKRFEDMPEEMFQKYRKRRYERHVKEIFDDAKQSLAEKYMEKLREEKGDLLMGEFIEEFDELYDSEDELEAAAFEDMQRKLKREALELAQKEIEQSDNEEAWKSIEAEAEKRTAADIERYGEERLREKIKGKVAEMRERTTVKLKMVADEEIFLGGTKPMSQYIAADGSKWLAKQAVTCVGTYKPSGAILTEIGSNIQKLVDESTAVEAFVGQTKKHGMVSFQRRLKNVVSSKVLDLFKFSRHPELATQATTKQVEDLMPQILREHVTDWLLCNFDTKGENFILTQEPGQPMVLHGIDKEAAFNKILDPAAQQMSTTYKPHANNTLYNVVFEKFANGEMEFDLRAAAEQIEKITAMGDDQYMAQYQSYFDYLTQKADGKEKELAKVERIRANILARKTGLKDEYIRFFTELIERRCQKVHPDEAAALRLKYYGEGGDRFRF